MKKTTRLNDTELSSLIRKIISEDKNRLPYPIINQNDGLNNDWFNDYKSRLADGVYTDFDKAYDYKLSNGVWYTKRKGGSTTWIDLSNNPKALSILSQKLEQRFKEKPETETDNGLTPQEKLKRAKSCGYSSWNEYKLSGWKCGKKPKPTPPIDKSDTLVSKTTNPVFLNKLNPVKISTNKSVPIFDAGQKNCAQFVREFDKQMPKPGNAWIAHDNSRLGDLVFSSFHNLSPQNIKTAIDYWLKLDKKGGGEESGEDNVNLSKFVGSLVPKTPPTQLQLGDVVGIYLPGSKHFEEAFYEAGKIFFAEGPNGKKIPGKTIKSGKGWGMNTHLGVVGAIKDGQPIILHNISGQVYSDPMDKLVKDSRIAWVRRHGASPMALSPSPSIKGSSLTENYIVSRLKKKFFLAEQGFGGAAGIVGVPQNSKPMFSSEDKKLVKSAYNSYTTYKTIPEEFRVAAGELIKEGYNLTILKAALGIIGRESTYGQGTRYNLYYLPKLFGAMFNTSLGPAQMKPTTASELGMLDKLKDNILTTKGSIIAVYRFLIRSYKRAKEMGYSTTSPSVNFKNGTGNAALDISIGSYNIGLYKIFKYCETNDPNIKKNCNLAGKTVNSDNDVVKNPSPGEKIFKVTNKYVPNYLPNIKGNKLTTHGYVKEVSERISQIKL